MIESIQWISILRLVTWFWKSGLGLALNNTRLFGVLCKTSYYILYVISQFDDTDGLSCSYGHGSFTSPIHIIDTTHVDERNIDECIAHSPSPSHELTRSHEPTRSHELTRSHEPSRSHEPGRSHDDPDLGTGKFVREAGIRRRPSLEAVKKKSLSPQRLL